jgi:hypothetical protein
MSHRVFVDSIGRHWEVWDVIPQARGGLSERWAGGWLAFETRGERRRLAPVPESWESLPEAELAKLCEKAHEAPTSRRLIE